MALVETQLVQDRNARATAVPFRGSIWGLDYFDGADRSLARQEFMIGFGSSDVDNYVGGVNGVVGSGAFTYATITPSQVMAIRILQPHFGEVVSCYLDIGMTFASSDNGMTCQIGIGTFATGSPNYTANTSYSTSYMNQSWNQISGHTTPMVVTGGSIAPNTLNLLPALYPSSDPNYVRDFFVLVIQFNRTPAAGFVLNYLNVNCSVQGIV